VRILLAEVILAFRNSGAAHNHGTVLRRCGVGKFRGQQCRCSDLLLSELPSDYKRNWPPMLGPRADGFNVVEPGRELSDVQAPRPPDTLEEPLGVGPCFSVEVRTAPPVAYSPLHVTLETVVSVFRVPRPLSRSSDP